MNRTHLIFSLFSVLGLAFFAWASPTRQSDDGASECRTVTEIRHDTDALLKKSKTVADSALFTSATIDLCLLHREIVSHEKFGTNQQLTSLRARIATRLKDISRDIQRELEKRSGGRSTRDVSASGSNSQNTAEPADAASYALSKKGIRTRDLDLLAAEQAYFLDCLTGGSSQYLSYLPGNFAPPWDHGPELVNLIESTILPDFWLSNGGNGRIHYYQPLRILVISGTAQVHDDLTDLLRRMRSLSR